MARLAWAAAVCALALAAYLAGVALKHPGQMLNWYDLKVYDHAGLIARSTPRRLYTWELHPGIKFTYTPFYALVFAVCSLLPWAVLSWLMTVTSLVALAATLWLTLGALGWRGRQRATLLAGAAAASLWTEPVQRALHLGQIELLLMVLIVWDMCQPDRRWWKGAGVGVAAGIKLVPLIFIGYLVLAGKLRQAAAVTAAFLGTVVIGFAFLPQVSAKYWLTGYFLHADNVGDPRSLLNQSLLGLVARAIGNMRDATPVWLGLFVLIAVLGLAAAAVLDRAGRSVAGWLTCALGLGRAGHCRARGCGAARQGGRALGLVGAGRRHGGPARRVGPASAGRGISPARQPAGGRLELVRRGWPRAARGRGRSGRLRAPRGQPAGRRPEP
jgi:alpha-1,2-mannosyltransferase